MDKLLLVLRTEAIVIFDKACSADLGSNVVKDLAHLLSGHREHFHQKRRRIYAILPMNMSPDGQAA